ncbi:MAG: hypothetical protein ORN26_01990, partial [Candidatus Pacebacteria bacterium]|nr:hypothetical protein [Candidatus Paceibacterota bacterium]
FIKTFFIFFFLFLIQFINIQKINAYEVPENICAEDEVSHTEYIIDASGLNGTLPLCFKDPNGDNLRLKTDVDFPNVDFIKISSGTTGVTSTTEYLFTGTATHTVNFVKNFTTSDLGVEREINFFLRDTANNEATAIYRLTLKPAFRVKFLNPDPKDGVLTDEFSTLKKESDSSSVSVESPYPIIVYEGSTSTKMAFGGFVKDPVTIIDSTTKKI